VEHPECPACGQSLGDFRDGPVYFAHLAAAYQEQQAPEKALAAWQAVEILQPDYPHLPLRLGELQAEVGRTEAAIDALQRAMLQPEDELPATLALGQIFQELRRWDEAKPLLQRLLANYPKAATAHFAMGWLLMEQGQLRAAFPYIQKTTQLNPQHGQAWLRLGQLQEQFKNPKQAARAYRQASLLLSHHSLDNLRAHQKLQVLEPGLPQMMRSNWGELLRQMTGPILICLLAALLDAGLRPWWIPLTGWVAILLSILGAFLWVSGSSLPQNPLMHQLLGPRGLASSELRFSATSLGLFCWLLALGLILLPLGRSFPEVPPL
jgi:tetratricopeptide (TPR) repeat protein